MIDCLICKLHNKEYNRNASICFFYECIINIFERVYVSNN